MAGFKATEQVEELTYDFNPHASASGVIPEPTSDQIETYRKAIVAGIESLGLDPETLTGEGGISLDQIGPLMEKSSEMEAALLGATAALTGLDSKMLDGLPYRVKAAFLGWIMGTFFNPEA